MAEELEQDYGQRFFLEVNTRIRDLEEKQRLLKDRMLLITDSFVKEREKNFNEIRELKKDVEVLKLEAARMKAVVLNIAESVNNSARKEELMTLQRQFNLFRSE